MLLLFAAGLIYEWCMVPEEWLLYAAFLGVLALLAYPLWRLFRHELKRREGPLSKWLFLLAAVAGALALFFRCVESKEWMRVPHIMWLPQSIGFILYGLFHFFAVWHWEKLHRSEFQKRMDAGESVWKNVDLSKGKET